VLRPGERGDDGHQSDGEELSDHLEEIGATSRSLDETVSG
jgi:hypothetical protein